MNTYPKRRAAQSRAAILAAAEAAFTEYGYEVSMDLIGKTAGVSRATLFSHFPKKETLYRELIKAISEAQLTPILEPLHDGTDFEANLRHFAIGFANAVLSKRSLGIHRLTITENQRFPELSDSHFTAGIGRVLPVLETYLIDGILRGLVRKANPRLLAEQFLVSVVGYRQQRALLGHKQGLSPDTKGYVDSALEILMLHPTKRSSDRQVRSGSS